MSDVCRLPAGPRPAVPKTPELSQLRHKGVTQTTGQKLNGHFAEGGIQVATEHMKNWSASWVNRKMHVTGHREAAHTLGTG